MEGMGLEHVMGGRGGGFPSDPSPTILAGANGFVVVVLWRAGSWGCAGALTGSVLTHRTVTAE